MSPRTTIVTVCYNSEAVLPDMLNSLPEGCPVILVDNASRDPQALVELARAHEARLVSNARNLGFGVGNNRGAAEAQTEFLLLLNPDTELAAGCIDALENAAKQHPGASAFNPRLRDRKGGEIFRRRTRLDPTFRLEGPPPDTDHDIPALLGAAIFVRREQFLEIGGFDEKIFLYHEDDDLSLRLRELGPLMRIAGAVVTHQEGRSSARTAEVAAFKAYHMARSKVYAYGKHGLRAPWIRTMGQALLGLISPLMLNKRKRAKALGFLRGAWSARKDQGRFSGGV